MNENQATLINEAIRLIQRRAVDLRRTISQRMSYNSALTMLLYAINENAECLAQFDDVKLYCEECARFGSDWMQDIQFCNACEREEFFECRGRIMTNAYCPHCECDIEQDDDGFGTELVKNNIYEKVTGQCPKCGRKYTWFNVYCFHCVEDVEEVD